LPAIAASMRMHARTHDPLVVPPALIYAHLRTWRTFLCPFRVTTAA
jgi:hypothetical protein